jgi:hypothetical protein
LTLRGPVAVQRDSTAFGRSCFQPFQVCVVAL